jgi:hypothetical protein
VDKTLTFSTALSLTVPYSLGYSCKDDGLGEGGAGAFLLSRLQRLPFTVDLRSCCALYDPLAVV